MFFDKKEEKNHFNKDLCVLTFDDGYKDCIKYVLPELKKEIYQHFSFQQ